MTTDVIRAQMRSLSAQARRTLKLHAAGAVGVAECQALAEEMHLLAARATVELLDQSDRAEAAGDHQAAEELFGLAMGIEAELLREAPPVEMGRR